jgi:hypothetical protein
MIRYAILLVAVIIGGWLLFDGTRAMATGSYTTPRSGAHAGQLGPWAKVVRSVGLQPTGPTLKLIHVVLGGSWLLFGVLVFRGASSAWWPLLVTALLSLWYLPFGTIAGVVVVGLLLYNERGVSDGNFQEGQVQGGGEAGPPRRR